MVLKRDQRKAMPKRREEAVAKHKISKYIKKKPKFEVSKRENTYVFEGFYEKLKQIDVKHGHSMEANFTYDRLLEEKDLLEGEDSELFRSNFIQLLRSEKANNKTKEFSKVYSDIERFCFSYPLLIHNKTKIVERLLFHLQSPDAQKVVQAGVIELFIALIKDFRSEIYQDFLNQIMPSVIGALDISNVILVDKIFTLMSFGVKYLTKSIKEDLENFYQTYVEMLAHRNKFVKKFAAQSFCYVVRKLPFDNHLLSIILKPIL
jgi:U3 small nucleolar RNA-associated protein 20